MFSVLFLDKGINFCIFFIVFLNVFLGSLIYEKLGERAFGWPGKMAAFGSIIMQNIGGERTRLSLKTLLTFIQFLYMRPSVFTLL